MAIIKVSRGGSSSDEESGDSSSHGSSNRRRKQPSENSDDDGDDDEEEETKTRKRTRTRAPQTETEIKEEGKEPIVAVEEEEEEETKQNTKPKKKKKPPRPKHSRYASRPSNSTASAPSTRPPIGTEDEEELKRHIAEGILGEEKHAAETSEQQQQEEKGEAEWQRLARERNEQLDQQEHTQSRYSRSGNDGGGGGNAVNEDDDDIQLNNPDNDYIPVPMPGYETDLLSPLTPEERKEEIKRRLVTPMFCYLCWATPPPRIDPNQKTEYEKLHDHIRQNITDLDRFRFCKGVQKFYDKRIRKGIEPKSMRLGWSLQSISNHFLSHSPSVRIVLGDSLRQMNALSQLMMQQAVLVRHRYTGEERLDMGAVSTLLKINDRRVKISGQLAGAIPIS